MEPGRCVSQTLYGVSKSHRESPVDLTPLCFMRKSDRLFTSEDSSSSVPVKLQNGVSITLSVSSGGLLAGSLSQADLDIEYGSAASAEFSPFVVLPDVTDTTSRSLRGRLTSFPSPYLYLSPVAGMQLSDDVAVSSPLPASVSVSVGQRVMMLFWSAETQQWKSLDDVCSTANETYDPDTKTLTSKICFSVFVDQSEQSPDSHRRKRSTPDPSSPPSLSPRMLAVAVVDRNLHNSPPVIHNITLTVTEDVKDGTTVNITYTDNDDDVVEFSLLQQPQHGTASVTSEGVLTYWPKENYAGDDVVSVRGVEVLDAASLASGASAHVEDFNVSVTVVNTNDPPDIVFIPDPSSNSSGITETTNTSDEGIEVSVLVEGNTTTRVPLGNLVIGDLDLSDSIILLNKSEENLNATFHTTYAVLEESRPENSSSQAGSNTTVGNNESQANTNSNGPNSKTRAVGAERGSYETFNGTVYKNKPTPYKVEEAKALSLTLDQGFQGFVKYEAKVKDDSDAYSMPLTLAVHVLINPCHKGYCEATTPGDTCSNPQRAFSFENYRCHCHIGYEGEWCEREINECATNPCVFLAHCRDLVGEYQCDFTIAACILGFAAAVLVVVVAVYCIRRRRRSLPEKDYSETSSTLDLFEGHKPQVFLHPESFPAPTTSPQQMAQRMHDNAVSHVSYELTQLRHSGRPCVYCDDNCDSRSAFTNPAYEDTAVHGDRDESCSSVATAGVSTHSERCVYCKH